MPPKQVIAAGNGKKQATKSAAASAVGSFPPATTAAPTPVPPPFPSPVSIDGSAMQTPLEENSVVPSSPPLPSAPQTATAAAASATIATRSRAVAYWTVMWFLAASSAGALMFSAEIFSVYSREAFPLAAHCSLGLALHILAGLLCVRIGCIRHAPHYTFFQPFAGGMTFIATQAVAYTLFGLSILTLYLYFLAPTAVPTRGALAVASGFSMFSSWFQFMSLQYFRTEKETAASLSLFGGGAPLNEARGAAVLIVMEAVLAGFAQWHHERGAEDVARAIGFLLLVAHVIAAAVCYLVVGSRHVPDFRWFVPFSGKLVDVAAQGVSWTGFATAVLGFRVMLEPSFALTTATAAVPVGDGHHHHHHQGDIGWGFFGAVGTAANIGLLLQMRARIRKHREESKQKQHQQQQQEEWGKDKNSQSRLQTSSSNSSTSTSNAAFFARSSRAVLTLVSILIALYVAALNEPLVGELLTRFFTARGMHSWRVSTRVLLQCTISFPVVTHITGISLQAYNVRNPFASRLAGTEFVALQLLGWAAFTAALMIGFVTRGVAEPWTAALALLAQLLISSSVSLVDRKPIAPGTASSSSSSSSAAAAPSADASQPTPTPTRGERVDGDDTESHACSSGGESREKLASASPLRIALSRVSMRGVDEIFNGVFLTGLVGCTVAILVRSGCDFVVSHHQQQKQQEQQQRGSNIDNKDGTGSELPFSVVVAMSTVLWGTCVPLLQFSLGGVGKPFQGSPLYAALQALGWTSYVFILVLLALVSVDVASATTADGLDSEFSRYHPFQFTSQAALMLIPLFLVTVSAFFSSSSDLGPQQAPHVVGRCENDDDDDAGARSPSPSGGTPWKIFGSAPQTGSTNSSSAPGSSSQQQMSAEEIQQLKKMRAALNPVAHSHLATALDQLLLAATARQQSTPTKNKKPSDNNTPLFSDIQRGNLKPNVGGDAIAAIIVVVCCLAIASLALFVAAEHMGREAARPLHVGILGGAALCASAAGSLFAHARIGPALHGSDVYSLWMPFQGGVSFVGWQFVGFGTMASSLLLFLVDLLRRRSFAQQQQQQQQHGGSAVGGSFSSLVPSGLLGGIAPVLVLCSTFTFDKTKTALDQRGSVVYENAEALLIFVVLGASYLLAATSELWLRNDWELATIPLLMGSCAAVITMPVAVIAIRKAADLQRFRSSDTVEAMDMREVEEGDRIIRSRSDSSSSLVPAAGQSDEAAMVEDVTDDMTPHVAAAVSLRTALVGAPLVLVECLVLAICAAIPVGLFVYGSNFLYHNYMDALQHLVAAYKLAVIAIQVLLLGVFWWFGLLAWTTATACAFFTYSIPLFLGGVACLFPFFRPHALGAWWFLAELVLGIVPPYWIQPLLTLTDCIMMTACSWQAFKIFTAGGPIGFTFFFWLLDVSLKTVAPGIGLAHLSDSVLGNDTAYGRVISELAANSAATPAWSLADALTTTTTTTTTNNSNNSTATACSSSNIPPFMFPFGNTCSLQLENSLLFLLLILYKLRYLRSPEETGRLRSKLLRKIVRIFVCPGLVRYFSLRIFVDDDSINKSDTRGNNVNNKKTLDASNFLSWNEDKRRPRNVIFGWHPHGIFSFTVPWLTLTEEWRRAAKGALPRDVVPFAANVVFNVPIMRDWAMWLGARAATRTAIVNTITDTKVAKSAMIVPGGQAELIENAIDPKVLRLIGFHVGFIRIAVQKRVPPCPVMGFGENNVLDNIHLPTMQKLFLRILGFPFPIVPMGFAYTWLPRRVPVMPIIGRPIDIEAVWRNIVRPPLAAADEGMKDRDWPAPHSTEEKLLVDAVAECYYDELARLFYKYRAEAGCPNTELHLIQQKHSKKE